MSALLTQARRYLVGGVNSPVRAFRAVGAEPLLLAGGRGATVTDVTGREYVDLIMGWGALILGHAHPAVRAAAQRRLRAGWHLGLTHEAESLLARAIVEAFPGTDRVRFATSGTEACMVAIRLARGVTRRSRLLTFEGCYHGHSDSVLVKRGSGLATLGLSASAGVLREASRQTIIVPYNDPEASARAFRSFGDTIAAVLVEPVAANMGLVPADPAWLKQLRQLAARHGSLLVFDEVVTGFRLGYGGAQTLLGVRPDLTVLGKIIGGGFPIGAVAGPNRLMRHLAPEGPVYHAGTFAGHPVSMAAGVATLRELKQHPPYRRLDALGARVARGLREAAASAGLPAQVHQHGSLLTMFCHAGPIENFSEAQRADRAAFAALANAFRARSVLLPPSQFETMFLSAAHRPAHVERMLSAARVACQAAAAASRTRR
ncbi:MAG: glutamate-1-semialdehyde 2,1-aminomutase [Candidatus Omnitrophica bacterium]|nr:glutamate-1-semialdehyde 2,1-aminomutase [Candidatus Omnitrophota bacterium]